jgi:hypothetical protein
MLITKYSKRFAAQALTTSLTTTAEIDIGHYTSGEIYIPSGSSITTLTYYASPCPAGGGGVYVPANDSTPAVIVQTVSGPNAYPIPAALFGGDCIKIVVNAAGTVDIVLKS